MIKTTVEISGMVCGMCEAHINDAIRAAFPVKKVASSRAKGETVILSEALLDRQKLKQTIAATGYVMLSVREETTQRRSLLARLSKRQP
jgi:copper chaperone CopZ